MRLTKRRRTRLADPDAGLGERKAEGEYRPAPRLAPFDHDAPIMPLGNLTADVQAQPGAGHVAEVGIANPMEPLEHEPAFGFGNPHSIVSNAHDALSVFGRHGYRQSWRSHRI